MRNSWQKIKLQQAREHQEKVFEDINGHSFIKRDAKQVLLTNGNSYTEFMSCGYLGLDQDKRLYSSFAKALEDSGMSFPAARHRLKYHGLDTLNDLLNEIYNAYSVVFSSTHMVHLGVLPLLASGELPGFPLTTSPAFILDKNAHTSMQINIGLMQQFGITHRVMFNNLDLLEQTIKEVISKGYSPILMSDSVGSMGALYQVKELYEIAEKYNCYLYLDDAHGMSVYGKNGAGYVINEFNRELPSRVILISSLAKAFGTYGGLIIVKNPETIDFIKKYCSTYIFSGSLITPLIMSSIESAKIHLTSEINTLQQQLINNITLFDSLIDSQETILNYNLHTPIRALKVGNELKAIQHCEKLRNAGILTTVAMYPTVAKGEAIIRFGICANHTNEEIKKLCTLINQLN